MLESSLIFNTMEIYLFVVIMHFHFHCCKMFTSLWHEILLMFPYSGCQKFSQSDIIINNHLDFTIISFVLSGSKGQELKSFTHYCSLKLVDSLR